MKTLLTRARSRLCFDPSADGGARRRARRFAPVAIALVAVLVTAVTVAIGLASGDHEERAVAGTTETTAGPTSETTGTDSSTEPAEPPAAPPAPAPAPAPEPAPAKAPASSAAADLAGYFAAVERVDQRIEDAAERYDASVGPDTVRVDDEVREAVRAIQAGEAETAIPPGLPPDLLLKVLVVQDDLATRAAALRGAIDEVDAGQFEAASGCLENGRVKAERFDSDVAAAKALAGSSAPIDVAEPDSRAAAELALRLSLIHGLNGGCGACGSPVSPVSLVAIAWSDRPTAAPGTGVVLDGTIDGIGFTATYRPGAGWEAALNAC
jgi:hypothetical protein